MFLREEKLSPPRVTILNVGDQGVPIIEDVVPESAEVRILLQRLRDRGPHCMRWVTQNEGDVLARTSLQQGPTFQR